jgi:ankyrin repeat protein
LLERGADINAAAFDGQTPFFVACYRGNLEMAHLLHEQRADINLADQDGTAPVHAAACAGHVHIIQFLSQIGVNPSTDKVRPTDSRLSEALRGRPRALGRCRSAARPRTRPRGIVEAVRQPITNYGTRTHVHDSWWGPSHHALRCHLVHR